MRFLLIRSPPHLFPSHSLHLPFSFPFSPLLFYSYFLISIIVIFLSLPFSETFKFLTIFDSLSSLNFFSVLYPFLPALFICTVVGLGCYQCTSHFVRDIDNSRITRLYKPCLFIYPYFIPLFTLCLELLLINSILHFHNLRRYLLQITE